MADSTAAATPAAEAPATAAATAEGGAAASAAATAAPMFRKFSRKGKGSFRKRSRAKSSKSKRSDEGAQSAVVKVKKQRTQLNAFSTSTKAKKAPASDLTIKSTRSAAPQEYGGGATATLEIDTAHDRDGRALLERKIDINMELEAAQAEGGTQKKVYRGQRNYQTFKPQDKAKVGLNKITGTMGPLRAPANVRGSVRFDYQMDICKDYKDTGYCGFGDSCKFMHDRGDYKAGWQIEKEWEEAQKRKADGGGSDDDDNKYVVTDSDDDELPFACHICREEFKNPIVTKCGHYFCFKCAVGRYKKTSKCAVCNKQTMGIFNVAPKLLEKLKERKAEEEQESGGDSGGDDDSNTEGGAGARSSGGAAGAGAGTGGGDAAGSGGEDGADKEGEEEEEAESGGGWVTVH